MRKRITVRKKSDGAQSRSYIVTGFTQYRNLKKALAKDDSIYVEETDTCEPGTKVSYKQKKYKYFHRSRH